jgi:hypothetical protein
MGRALTVRHLEQHGRERATRDLLRQVDQPFAAQTTFALRRCSDEIGVSLFDIPREVLWDITVAAAVLLRWHDFPRVLTLRPLRATRACGGDRDRASRGATPPSP